MPIVVFASKDAVPEPFRDEAVEKEGKFEVDLASGKKLGEFRDNNTKLVKERDEFATVVSKVKPLIERLGKDKTLDDLNTSIDGWLKMETQVKDGTLKTTADIETEVTRRTTAMKEGFDNQLREKTGELANTQGALAKSESARKKNIVDRLITDAVLHPESGVRVEALSDILTRAGGTWVVNEKDTAVARDGDAPLYGDDGATAMTGKEWVAGLKKVAPHFFKASSGGDASGGHTSGSNATTGGFSPEEFRKLSTTQKLQVANGHLKKT